MNKLSRRLDKIEQNLRPGKESEVVPQVIVVTQDDRNIKEKGIVVIGGYAEKQEKQ